MKKIKSLLLISVLVLSALGLTACGQEKATTEPIKSVETKTETKSETVAEPKAEETSKATAPTQEMTFVSSTETPTGCASCHIKVSADKDYSLAAKLKAKPNHPKVDVKTVADCMKCHENGQGTFKKLMHKVHYKADSAFVKNYKGSCVNCHKLTSEGQVVVAGLESAGTKLVELAAAQVDKAPKGCLDCHVKVNEQQDYTFGAVLKQNPNHPKIDFNDFNQCYKCHTGEFALEKKLHPKHLQSATYKNYGSSCLNCHSVAADGSVSVKGKK